MKTFTAEQIYLKSIALTKAGEDWQLTISYNVGNGEAGNFHILDACSKSFTLTAGEQTSIKSFLSDKIVEIKQTEDITEIIY